MCCLNISAFFRSPQYNGSRSISKQDTSRTIRPVCQIGKALRPDYNGCLIYSLTDICLRRIQRKQKSGTRSIQVKAGSIHCPYLFLYLTGTPPYPFIIGIHHLGQFIIIPNKFRNKGTGPAYFSNHNLLPVIGFILKYFDYQIISQQNLLSRIKKASPTESFRQNSG